MMNEKITFGYKSRVPNKWQLTNINYNFLSGVVKVSVELNSRIEVFQFTEAESIDMGLINPDALLSLLKNKNRP